ncbi:MAG TPA: hypothetical protein DCG19_12400 [Cryomorphaceae bacterium]|nr:hypothetical protein [Owenweeksia sp.]MBF98057.1 hypothetical protein [Owenweeksia sp.]HAD98202.1 hypothetical protein [Cryomorphaceae bacterium]HBF18689.1 hypothetical protein [Cryomorphaceae bacterium]HCQ17258.1 hypothetical protein [Cryomorphaceae bacterium]
MNVYIRLWNALLQLKMEIYTVVIQFGLGVVLFFIINWIGKHSYSIGYMSISVFAKVEEAPAFNFLIRVLTPTVYLIISASVLYALKLDKYVDQYYLVSLYYIIFRLSFNLLTGRGLLLNWYRQLLYWVSILVISYFAYTKLIISRENLLPDFTTLANELWIIILIFLFHVTNNVRFSSNGTIKRKEKYLITMVNRFKNKYGAIIDKKISNEHIKGLIYAILIIENFNRPRLARWIEYLRYFITGKPHTLGIMQYYTYTYISDSKSVKLGVQKINAAYKSSIADFKNGQKGKYFGEWALKNELASAYNTGSQYNEDVLEMWHEIMNKFYPNTNDVLLE